MLEARFEQMRVSGPIQRDLNQSGVDLIASIIHASHVCEAAHMDEAVRRLNRIQLHITERVADPAMLVSRAREAREVLADELKKRKFLHIKTDRTDYLDQEFLFGELVNNAFPSAALDIREAGNCLAAECTTASVFHLMRAVEVALRAIAKDRKITFANKPLDQQGWGTIVGALDGKLKDMREADSKNWAKLGLKDIQTRFYGEAIQELRGFNEAWRRHISHAREDGIYDRDYASSVMEHVKVFMQKLAVRIGENKPTSEFWDVE